MAKRKTPAPRSSAAVPAAPAAESTGAMGSAPELLPGIPIDPNKFDLIHQVGGIQTALMDHPSPGGAAGAGGRVALVNTGSGLRFTVALDRGGDIVEASFNRFNLAFLTPSGYKPANPAYHREEDWLDGWPGGLVTTCGPVFIGGPREEDGVRTSLHGHYSNTPAAVEMILNPDLRRGKSDMMLSLVVRDTRMYGPVVEVRRQIQCQLGQPVIHITDQVTNRFNSSVPHNWLYHVNLGYPLLDQGARLVLKGKLHDHWGLPKAIASNPTPAALDDLKNIPDPLPGHTGTGSWGTVIDPEPDGDGMVHAGLINRRLGLGVELYYPVQRLPRLANWQHFGPAGCYVTGVEPFSGSLMGKAKDNHPLSRQYLEPGETKRYQLTLRVLEGAEALETFAKQDGEVKR